MIKVDRICKQITSKGIDTIVNILNNIEDKMADEINYYSFSYSNYLSIGYIF